MSSTSSYLPLSATCSLRGLESYHTAVATTKEFKILIKTWICVNTKRDTCANEMPILEAEYKKKSVNKVSTSVGVFEGDANLNKIIFWVVVATSMQSALMASQKNSRPTR
jgi:hypothetical protein